jgi:translocation and assembly module TamB
LNPADAPNARGPRAWPKRIARRPLIQALAAGFLALIVAGLMLRFGAETPAGRALVLAPLEGLSLGSLGRLHLEGVQGDVWRDFTIRRAEVIDAGGPWLDAHEVRIQWRWFDLLRRRAHVSSVAAKTVLILRRPTITAAGPSAPAPVSVVIDRLETQLETLPAFSVSPGRFQLVGSLKLVRTGGASGTMSLASLLTPGDGLEARFRVGVDQRMYVDAQAHEDRGGAIAGSLGLPPGARFRLDAHAIGTADGGKLHLRAFTGERSIAQADAIWDKTGGAGDGRLSLAASSLSAPLERRLGSQISLSGRARAVGGGLYDVAVQTRADNGALALSGVINPLKQTTRGDLRLTARIEDLSRVIAAPTMGSGSIDGRLSGSPRDWRLAGRMAVSRLTFGGYSLDQFAGPLDLSFARRELRAQATLDGTGGQGRGLLAAAAGAHPRLAVDASRLADGRVLFRALKAQGDGLRTDATGEVGLFGALQFKGELQVSSLASPHHGVRGAVDARWTAAQRKADEPWTVAVDAQGADFASGWSNLDRLLGPKPRLKVEAALGRDGTKVTSADLRAANGDAQATGSIGWDGALDLAVKWAAHGPFEAGPLEIAGDAAGSGAIKGSIGAPRADLAADFERVDLPGLTLRAAHVAATLTRGADSVDGQIAVTAGGDYGPAHAQAGFRFVADGMEFRDIDAAAGGATAAGSLSLQRLRPSSADLVISVGPGAFATQGRADARLKVVDGPDGPNADLKLSMSDFALLNPVPNGSNVMLRDRGLIIVKAQISAAGPLASLPYKVTGEGVVAGVPVSLKGSGVAEDSGERVAVSFEGGGRVRHAEFQTQSPASIAFDRADAAAKLNLLLGGGHLDLDARQHGDSVDAKMALTGVDLGALGEDLVGRVSAQMSLNGRGDTLQGALRAHLDGARSRDAPAKLALAGDVRADLAGSRLTVDATANGAQPGDKAEVSLALPAEATAKPFRIAVSRTQPIEGRIDAEGELQPIWDLFFGGDRELGGRLTAHATVSGDLNDPRFTGHAALAQGRYEEAATGLKLRNLTADIDLRDNTVDVQRFSANDANGGALSGQGRASLASGGASTLTLKARGFRLLDNDAAKVVASGDVAVTRDAAGKARLSGALTIDRADISTVSSREPPGVVSLDVIERNKPVSADDGAIALAPLPSVALDISLRAPGKIYVRGLGLNVEMSVGATVTGSIAAPVLKGQAHVVRGDYDLAGKRFQIDDSGVVTLASMPENIRLDLSASWDDPTLTAVVKIKGTAAKPEITLSSTPSLPSDEVLSQVLFGQSAAQLSPVEAAQLAATLASLATGGGFDVMGGLRNFARLDRLALNDDVASSNTLVPGGRYNGVSVSGGKYIGNKVYLELTGGGRYGPSAQVEVRANRALSFISELGGEAGAKLSVRWKLNYGRPKKDAK